MGECLSVLLVEGKEFAFLAAEELQMAAARMRNEHPGDAAALLGGKDSQAGAGMGLGVPRALLPSLGLSFGQNFLVGQCLSARS